jgi:hypothetical protein
MHIYNTNDIEAFIKVSSLTIEKKKCSQDFVTWTDRVYHIAGYFCDNPIFAFFASIFALQTIQFELTQGIMNKRLCK